MNEIAVYFQKFELGDDMYAFKPSNIIRGNYDEEQGNFITDADIQCEPIFGGDPDAQDYFWFSVTIDRLREVYGYEADEQSMISEYFYTCLEYFYIGIYDPDIEGIKLLQVHKDQFLDENETLMDEIGEDSIQFTFDREYLQNLRNSKTIKEVRKKLDDILNIDINKIFKEQVSETGENLNKETNTQPEHAQSTHIKKDIITLDELRQVVLKQIIAQDDVVNDVTRTIMKNQRAENPKIKSHILVTGPTGTGKTEIAKIICETLGLPFFKADATAYTEEGYVGKSVYSMLKGLINAANGDIKLAQNGILVIDEIDKKVLSGANDKFGLSVLYSLLKIMDREIIELDMGANSKPVYFDTSSLTIICMGAFELLYKDKLKESKKIIGFSDKNIELPNKEIVLTKEDLITGGTPSEFIGRIGKVTSTHSFSHDELIHLLTISTISPLVLQQQFFKEAFNTELSYSYGYASEIARKAMEKKTNARELKSLVEESLEYVTDEFLSGKKAKVLKINRDTVKDPSKYRTF